MKQDVNTECYATMPTAIDKIRKRGCKNGAANINQSCLP